MTTKIRKYQVHLSTVEMACVGNAIKGFYTWANTEKMNVSPEQTMVLRGVMEKFKHAMEHQKPNDSDLIVPEKTIILAQ